MAIKTPFPFQQQAVNNTCELLVRRKLGSGIVHLATGLGKSICATEIVRQIFPPINEFGAPQHRGIFMAPAIELVFQMHANFKDQFPDWQHKLVRRGVMSHNILGIVMEKLDHVTAQVIVASIPTLVGELMQPIPMDDLDEETLNQLLSKEGVDFEKALAMKQNEQFKIDNMPIELSDFCMDELGNITKSPHSKRTWLVSERFDRIIANGGLPSYIIVDEAHHVVASGALLLIQRINQLAMLVFRREVYLIGLTATPVREDQRALSNAFKTMIVSRDFRWGIREGYLAPFATPVRILADTGTSHHTTFDSTIDWTKFVIEGWLEKGENRITVFYCGKTDFGTAVENSKVLAKAFNERGIPAVHLDGECCIGPSGIVENKRERRKYFRQVLEGKIKVITNFGVMIEGIDLPPIACVGLLTMTNSVRLTQIIGRALRKFEGNNFLPKKEDMLLIDYTGKDINIVPVGTLMGYKVDPTTEMYVEEDIEDELVGDMDGQALEMVAKSSQIIMHKGMAFSIPRILSKSQGEWYHDDITGALSLGIGKGDVLIICQPNMTMAYNMEYLIENGQKRLMGNGCEVPELSAMEGEQLRQYVEFFQWVHTLNSNFVLWHAKQGETKYVIPTRNYSAAHPALDVLEAEAVRYAYDTLAENDTATLFEKGKSWRREPMTDRQAHVIATLTNKPVGAISKGDASKLISHLKAYRAILIVTKVVDDLLKPFERYLI